MRELLSAFLIAKSREDRTVPRFENVLKLTGPNEKEASWRSTIALYLQFICFSNLEMTVYSPNARVFLIICVLKTCRVITSFERCFLRKYN